MNVNHAHAKTVLLKLKRGIKMQIRKAGYEDYGMREDEVRRLIAYCRSGTIFDDHEMLLQAAKAAKRDIANLLYFSITNKCSWEKLDTINYVPISKGDFYAYRRKTLALFRQALIKCGKWEKIMNK